MNLFIARLTGKLVSTEKFELRMVAEEERIARYRRVEQSAELKEYMELKQVVESNEFQQKKYNLKHTKYESTQVYQTLKSFTKLQKDKNLQLYFGLVGSQRLADYLAFRASENYVKLQSKKEVRNSLELRQMAAFEKSKEFKAYELYKDSKVPEQYKQLQEEVSTEAFKKEHIFWTNPNRWKTTDEYQQEVRFKQLSQLPDIRFFLNENREQIEAMEAWHATFVDECDWTRLADSPWRAGFAYKSPKLLREHSFANEQQAYNGGRNVGSIDGKLKLFTKHEKVTAPAWDAKKGFVNKDFDYTSDIIQTADSFRQKEGLFMAKLCVHGHFHHAMWLGSEEKLPLLSLFHYNGRHITIGNYSDKGFEGTCVKGINPEKFFVYSLRWTEKELIWYVNNLEVYRMANNLPKEKLFLSLCSFIDEKQHPMEGHISMGWVRAFSK